MKEIKKTKRNVYFSIISIFILGLLNVFKMRLIIQGFGTSGDSYNGLYQMLAQILVYLSILETGLRFPAISSLFEPFIKNEATQISSILAAVKKSYRKIFLVTFALGLATIPLVLIASKGMSMLLVILVTILFICRLTVPYIWQEVIVIVNVDNNAYWVTLGMNVANIVATIVSIFTIILTHSFFWMVFFETFFVVLLTSLAFIYMKRKYENYYKKDVAESFAFKDEIQGSRNLRLADALMNNTDIIVVSVVLGTVYGSSFSTYNSTSTILFLIVSTTIVESIKALLGKVYSEHNNGKIFVNMLHSIKQFNYCLISITIPMIFIFLKPFTELFFQPQYQQTQFFMFVFAFYFYLRMLRTPYHALKISTNRYSDFSKITLINAILNITLSIVLTMIFGTVGVLLGSTISLLITEFWFDIQKLELEEALFNKDVVIKELLINIVITWSLSFSGMFFVQPHLSNLLSVFIWVLPILMLIIIVNVIIYSNIYASFKMNILKILSYKK